MGWRGIGGVVQTDCLLLYKRRMCGCSSLASPLRSTKFANPAPMGLVCLGIWVYCCSLLLLLCWW
jgi:succinate-acetate transporter protein